MADETHKARRRQRVSEDMEAAMKAVEEGTAVSVAARQFKVPRKTLNDRVKGLVVHGTNPGPSTALTGEEEKALVATAMKLVCRQIIIACQKAISRKNTQYVYAQQRGTSEHITLLCGASAAGIALPPMIIFSKSFPGGSYRFNGPDDALYAKSDSGWIDSEFFLQWMNLLRHCGSQQPVVLFVYWHASHITLDIIDVALENNVVLFCLPPHTTPALQPLDVSVFRSLKSRFSKAVHALSFTKKDFVVLKREFARVVISQFPT
jgi:hypothetical protein